MVSESRTGLGTLGDEAEDAGRESAICVSNGSNGRTAEDGVWDDAWDDPPMTVSEPGKSAGSSPVMRRERASSMDRSIRLMIDRSRVVLSCSCLSMASNPPWVVVGGIGSFRRELAGG
jgi:hypothetical protein